MRYIIAHGHIFKNAGTTFDWSLRRNFGDGFLDHREDQLMRERREEHVRELVQASESLVALSSHHLCRPLPEMEGFIFLPVYFLRHPIDRVASVYEFEKKQQADNPGANAAKEKSFTEYVAWRLRPDVGGTIRNYQTRYLAGRARPCPAVEPGLEVLGKAMSAVREVPYMGVVDRYDESVVMIERLLREYFPQLDLAYVKQNVSRKNAPDSIQDQVQDVLTRLGSQRQQIIDANSLDLAIYHLVRQGMDRQIAEYDRFDEHLADFRCRCEALRRS